MAILVGVILGVTDKRTNSRLAPVAIGLTYSVLLLVVLPFTNGGLNPARSFAAAVFAGGWTWSQLWLFLVAPLVGAAIAALFYRAFSLAPVQDDLLAEDEVFVIDEATVVAGGATGAASAAVVTEEPTSTTTEVREEPTSTTTEVREEPTSTTTEVREEPTRTDETTAAGTGTDPVVLGDGTTDGTTDGTAPKA